MHRCWHYNDFMGSKSEVENQENLASQFRECIDPTYCLKELSNQSLYIEKGSCLIQNH